MKNKLKTIRICLYCILITFLLTSCDNETPGLQSQPRNSVETEKFSSSQIASKLSSESSKPDISGKGDLWADKKLKIGLIGPGAESTWRTTSIHNILNTAEDWNIDIEFVDGQGKQEVQIEHLEDLIEKEVDAIGLIPTVETGWEKVLMKAREAGIPILLLDRMVNCTDESLWTSRIVSNFRKQGQMLGEWFINYLEKRDRLDEEIKIVHLKEQYSFFAQEERSSEFNNIVEDLSNVDIIIKKWNVKNISMEKEYFTELAEYFKNNSIDVLFCHSDNIMMRTMEAMEIIQKTGLVPGEDILIISMDAEQAILEAIVEGKVVCAVETNPLIGDLFMEACVRLANGETIEREIHPVDRVFDITNAQAELDARKENGYGYLLTPHKAVIKKISKIQLMGVAKAKDSEKGRNAFYAVFLYAKK